MDLRNSLFGSRGQTPDRQRAGGERGPPDAGQRRPPPGYGQHRDGAMPPGRSGGHAAPARSHAPPRQIPLRLARIENKTMQSQFIFGNLCAVSPNDFPPNRDGQDVPIKLRSPMAQGEYVVTARPVPGFPDGCISLSDPQRTWIQVAMTDQLVGEFYDPFRDGNNAYLSKLDVDIGFASTKKFNDQTYDQDALGEHMIKLFQNQILAPGQRLLMDVQNVPLALIIKTVVLADLSMEKQADGRIMTDPNARGILVPQTAINFVKNPGSPIKLSGSKTRAPPDAIFAPDFKFEDMGIGGLDKEFSVIFRRAFASRILPPHFLQKLGIDYVKGILLYGPPGTGKTLLARQIGKMLNAREPKIVNGPEVLNKYVGQSEENIRKLFADAEKEYKEKGDESKLHIIIFDELDAVCKQRGSGAGGGTGVGDSVVNQLLSKLDGVDQLNNILLIGMTNRKDMIDDALLRPGRLEVQIEIGLPDESGRLRIFGIHTSKMAKSGILHEDVDLARLAAVTKNFSGAEISGLVRSAASIALNRHTRVDAIAQLSDDIENMKVRAEDFEQAMLEVKPAFGADDQELEESAIAYGILPFSPTIQRILDEGHSYAEGVRTRDGRRRTSVLLHGSTGSGTTALAHKIALNSGFPFIKAVTSIAMNDLGSETARKEYVSKAFSNAYKSPMSVLIIDGIERLIEWNPVGPRLSNIMVQALQNLLKAVPPKGHRLLILATTSMRSVLDQCDLLKVFNHQLPVPPVGNMRELETALNQFQQLESSDVPQYMTALRQRTAHGDRVGVGISTVLVNAEASLDAPQPAEWFADALSEAISEVNI